jgi:PIN domain nuclease of toxin-antitoxin system
MKVLLDAHALIWYVDQDHLLSGPAHAAITDPANDLFLSAGTIWEIGIKVGLERLSLSMPFRQWMNKAISDLGLTLLPITVEYADAQAQLPRHHGDPFDRLLAAQAQVESVPLVSADAIFDQYGVNRIWQAAT